MADESAVCAINRHLRFARLDSGSSTEGRCIGGVRDNEFSQNNPDDEIGPLHCHPERSEGPVALGNEMLRSAQHDRVVTHTDSWINVLNCIIGTYG